MRKPLALFVLFSGLDGGQRAQIARIEEAIRVIKATPCAGNAQPTLTLSNEFFPVEPVFA
jgi:hypothetical protein